MSSNARVAAFRGNVSLGAFGSNSYLVRLSPWLNMLPEGKRAHTLRVVGYFHDFTSGRFDALHSVLRKDLKEGLTPDQYAAMLKPIKAIYDSLSPKDRRELYLAVILHDIGWISIEGKRGQSWDHNKTGGREAANIFKDTSNLDFNKQVSIEEVCAIISNHGLFSNLGVDIFPEDIRAFSETLRKKILILDCLDITDKVIDNTTGSLQVEAMVMKYNKWASLSATEWREYRLRHLLSPSVFVTLNDCELKGLEREIAELTPEEQDAVHGMLIRHLRNRAFSVFHELYKIPGSEFEIARLMRHISMLIKNKCPDKGADVLFESKYGEGDIFDLTENEKKQVINDLRSKLVSVEFGEFGDLTFSSNGGVYKITLRLA